MYFLICLLLIGINLLKNIYMENEVNNRLTDEGFSQVGSIDCNGFLNIECELKDVIFEKKITNTNYFIKFKQINLLDFSVLEKNEGVTPFKLIVKGIKIIDERAIFLELKKPMDLNMTLKKNNEYFDLTLNSFREDLEAKIILNFKNYENFVSQNFSSINVEIKRDNNIVKKIIYELYKVKLLEIMQGDDAEFSSTRGMNIPLGVDSSKVIAKDNFLGEPYESMSILLNSEIETFDWVIENNENSNITNFVSNILRTDGVNKLQIKNEKGEK